MPDDVEYDVELYEDCITDAWDFYGACMNLLGPAGEPVCKMILDNDLEGCENIKTHPKGQLMPVR